MMLQPAGRRSKRKREPEQSQESLDPIALTLALWLGVVVGASGMIRLAQDASRDEALVPTGEPMAAHSTMDTSPFNPRILAFGG